MLFVIAKGTVAAIGDEAWIYAFWMTYLYGDERGANTLMINI